jgi:N-acetylneuraminate synthase/N,N'-diacetyllegionaminate synthase
MVKAIRDVEIAQGNGIKGPNEEEAAIKKVARRSIIARCNINLGDKLTESNLAIKRPGTGIEPRYYELIVHKKARIQILKDQVINWDMIE